MATYDVSKIIPSAYHEAFLQKNVNLCTDQAYFPNSRLLSGCTRVSLGPSVELELSGLSFTDVSVSEPEVFEYLGYLIPIEDGVATVVVGTPRSEILEYIEQMFRFLRLADASSAFALMNLLSNSTKNVVAENVATVRVKAEPVGGIVPCSL